MLGRHLGQKWIASLAAVAVSLGFAPAASVASLPDGRVYEQVSPPDKSGNVVGDPADPTERGASFGLASADGNSVVFVGSGAMGSDPLSSDIGEYIARRSVGWTTYSTIPRQLGIFSVKEGPPTTFIPASSFSSFLFSAPRPYVSSEPLEGSASSSNVFLTSDPSTEPTWIAKPTIENPIPALGNNRIQHSYLIVGGTSDFGSVYFTDAGTLLPEDASRAPHLANGMGGEGDAWGFYEWHGGTLAEAGALPDGMLDPFGAVPAATAAASNFQRTTAGLFDQAQTLDNELSTDGSRAFFVSPDPAGPLTECASSVPGGCTPELYVREIAPDGSRGTVLVSQSHVPGHIGDAAPDGPLRVENAQVEENGGSASYVYASPDGSQAFFASVDQLTSEAPKGNSIKEYEFNADTGALTYLPGVVGSIVATSPDGSDFIFENTTTETPELALWQGPGAGTVTMITSLPEASHGVSTGRSNEDGTAFVFRTNSPLAGGFNNSGGFAQLYRYEVSDGLACLSCAPEGAENIGDAHASYDNLQPGRPNGSAGGEPMTTVDARVMSSDGSRVFFDTPDQLVPQAANGKRHVYEWERDGAGSCSESPGCTYLISSANSSNGAYILDSSASGDDVFFTTDAGLVPGDVDDVYDVYDARVPRAGDNPLPPAAPCEGSACQSQPGPAQQFGSIASETLIGGGNLTPPTAVPVKPKTAAQIRTQKLAKALKACRTRKHKPKEKRSSCEERARRTYRRSK